MTKGRMSKIMRQGKSFGEIIIKTERARQGSRDLADFDRMCEAGAEMIALMRHEHLSFMGQPAEGGRMNDSIAITLKFRTRG
jgi:hypothetical protein